MYDLSVLLPISAATLHAVGYGLYNKQTFQGKTKPNPVSLFIWLFLAALNALTFSAMNDPVAALQMFVGTIGMTITFFYALIAGKLRWPKEGEWVMLVMCLLSILVWKRTDATLANMVIVVGVVLSFVPYIQDLWADPRLDKSQAWWFFTTAWGITSVSTYFFNGGFTLSMVMPLTMTAAHLAVALLSLEDRKRKWLERKRAQLAFVQGQIPELEKEIRTITNQVRGIVDSAVDRGSDHEQSRRGKRWSEVYETSTILARLKDEEADLKRELGVV